MIGIATVQFSPIQSDMDLESGSEKFSNLKLSLNWTYDKSGSGSVDEPELDF